eukprot:5768434-Alexandrium_andersonii.AAC.1
MAKNLPKAFWGGGLRVGRATHNYGTNWPMAHAARFCIQNLLNPALALRMQQTSVWATCRC